MAKKILIVDDEANVSKGLADILTEKGYQVFTAANSNEALKQVQDKEFNLILMDLVLKGDENGIMIFKEMKKIKPDLKALVYTGYGPEEEMRLILEAAAEGMIDEFLRKPVEPEELIKAIEKHLK